MSNMGHRGSYLGFTYNDIHSSTLGITRVSSSKRYTTELVPSLKDITTSLPGAAGSVYFGTYYTKRVLSVPFAFDGLTQEQITNIQLVWHDKRIHDLIFDEWPFKVYSAKVTGITSLKHLMFTDLEGNDIYKGEGSIQFTCYFPFARSRYAWQEEYTLENIPEWRIDDEFNEDDTSTQLGNLYYDFDTPQLVTSQSLSAALDTFEWVKPESLIGEQMLKPTDPTMTSQAIAPQYSDSPYINYDDWIESSQIPSRENYGVFQNGQVVLYNAGDVLMPTQWWYRVSDTPQTIDFYCDGVQKMTISNLAQSHLLSPTGAGADYYIIIDMPRATIQGYDRSMRPTGRLYNRYITNGNFFGIPRGEHIITVQQPIELKFNYLYL